MSVVGHRICVVAARMVLVIWALGLIAAGFQLGSWRQELSATLMQLQADAHFRARAQRREAVDPEWYRRKALALLSATERLRRDTTWTVFIPGSWRGFDDLEEQVSRRIEREFGEIVVETIRRELLLRASELTGVPLQRAAAGLVPSADCEPPVSAVPDRRPGAVPEELPEFMAAASYVDSVRHLDEAVDSYLALHQATAPPEQMHKLVRYALGKELPGSLARSARLFHGPDEVNVEPAMMRTQLQSATRCSLLKAMNALHTRMLQGNDLLGLERALAERSAGLFDAVGRPAPFDRTLERYVAVHALLEQQHALLAKGRNGWMRSGNTDLGPAYAALLAGIEGTRLLGPDALRQMQHQSEAAFAEFRQQFENAFGDEDDTGIVWLEHEQRFGLSEQRDALRLGLDALLQMPFMRDVGQAQGSRLVRAAFPLSSVASDAKALAEAHAQFTYETLPLFPAYAQIAVKKMASARVSELIYQRGHRALKAELPKDPVMPLNPKRFQQQREQVAQLQAILKETGGAYFAGRLGAILDGEVLRRLDLVHNDWREQPLHDARGSDFAWWQGEPLAVAQTLGAPEVARPSLARLAIRLDLLNQQAKALLALGSPSVAADPNAQRWLALQSELERYHARRSDSSLLRLEQYLAALGPDLRRENCAERLAANLPAASHEDDITQRHVQIHDALTQRCRELRMLQAAPHAGAMGQ